MSVLFAVNDIELPDIDDPQPVAAPFVNLLPPEIAERRAMRSLLVMLAAVVVGVLLLTGGLVYLAGSGKAAAQDDLAAQQAQTARLNAQVRSLDGARQAQAQLQAARAALQTAMSSEVLWSKYLDQLRLLLPNGVRLSNVAIAPTTASTGAGAGAGTAGVAPTTTTGSTASTGVTPGAVATVTIAGKAVDQDAVAAWLEALGQVKGFTNGYLTSTAADGASGLVTFTVTVDVTADALSHRFDNLAGS